MNVYVVLPGDEDRAGLDLVGGTSVVTSARSFLTVNDAAALAYKMSEYGDVSVFKLVAVSLYKRR